MDEYKYLVSASYDRSIKVWDLSNRNNDSNKPEKNWDKNKLNEFARTNEKDQHEAGIRF